MPGGRGGSSSSASKASPPPPPPLLETININISSSGSKAITDANTILWDTKWTDSMSKIEGDSEPYGHDCGTVPGNPNKSKDSDAVDKLHSLRDNANSVRNKFTDFVNSIYTDKNNGCYKELNRVIDGLNITANPFPNKAGLSNIAGSKILLTKSQVDARTATESNTIKSDIEGKVNTENIRTATEKARTATEIKRKTDLDNSQYTIKQEFAAKTTDLNSRISNLDGKITDAGNVKADRNAKVTTLLGIETNVNTQRNMSNDVSTSLSSAAAVNTQQLAYLTDRITNTQGIAVDGYEELYKAVILQNDLLEVAKSEMDNNISTTQRESKFVSKKRTFIYDIYIKLYTVYYILIIFFIGFLIFYKKLWSIYYKIALIIAGIIYPLCILTFESWVYNCWLYVLSLLTGSVYVYRPL